MRQIWRRVRRQLKRSIDRWLARRQLRRYQKTLVRCESCRQWVGTAYLMPIPGEAGGIDLRCEDCRRLWHQAIRDYYAGRAADAAAARYDRERREAA